MPAARDPPLATGGGGTGIWTEDAASPRTATGTSSDTYTLSGTYDEVEVHIQVEDVSGSSNLPDLRANGSSASNYNVIDASGTRTTGKTEIANVIRVSANGSNTRTFQADGRFAGAWRGGGRAPDGGADGAVGWTNTGLTSPLDSLTLLGGNFDVTWEVFGRDIGPAGEP